jgi:transcriptional regulator with XRE-family HTH domain
MTTKDLGSEMVARLRTAIQESNQSLNQLSGVCGVDRSRLSRFVRGERDLTLEAAAKLCEVLGLSLCTDQEPTKGRRPKKGK